MNNLHKFNFEKQRDINVTVEELQIFESTIASEYEDGKCRGPVHLSKNNEETLIELFQYVHSHDWVFSAWRNHYHAILHGVPTDKMRNFIHAGASMGINNRNPNFYASSIVGGIIPIALGTAMGLKRRNSDRKVWCFIGDMTMETGIFHEAYKYSQNHDLPLQFVVEDNNLSVKTPTDVAWGNKQEVPENVVYYTYEMSYPHHGTGKWVNF